MKKIFLTFFLLISFLNANESDARELELVFFKAGIDAMVNEFENEKNITKEQQKMIDFLHSKVYSHDLTLQKLSKLFENNKYELKVDNQFFAEDKNTEIIIDLQETVENLKKDLVEFKKLQEENEKRLLKFENKVKKNNIENHNKIVTSIVNKLHSKAFVNKSNVNIRLSPSIKSKVVQTLDLDAVVNIEFCDKYGWCKLENRSAFIAEHLLVFKNR